MSKAAQQSEPSMEEILASIRKIISDENDGALAEASKTAGAAAPEPAPEPPVEAEDEAAGESGDDILELTDDMVAETPSMVEAVEPEVTFEDEAGAMASPEPVKPVARQNPAPSETVSAAVAERLISPATDAAVGSAFGKLANTILSRDSHTLEDLVKEMLRPMLQEWLDDNLPGLVEKLVREEIERVSRGR